MCVCAPCRTRGLGVTPVIPASEARWEPEWVRFWTSQNDRGEAGMTDNYYL